MKRLEVFVDDPTLFDTATKVGTLFRDDARTGIVIRFEYAEEWLSNANAFPIDPLLRLHAGPFFGSASNEPPGVFQDSSPDRWGKLLMDRREAMLAREQSRPRRTLRSWDYLVGVDDGMRMGALRLFDADRNSFVADLLPKAPPATSLRELEHAATVIEQGGGADVDPNVRQLLVPGGSLGGARPKASFRDEKGEQWLAKFPSIDDRIDVGLWEFVAYELAIRAGIEMPRARMMQLSNRGHTFAVKRFDRHGASRRMYASAKTMLDMESDGASYLDIAEIVQQVGAEGEVKRTLEQLFRRAVFNVLIGNRDDHLRNHGFLRKRKGWSLSPAFDINPNPDKDNHVLALDDIDTTPSTELLLQNGTLFQLAHVEADAIVQELRTAVNDWQKVARSVGAKAVEIDLMQNVVDYNR